MSALNSSKREEAKPAHPASPFVFDVSTLLGETSVERRTQSGPSPERIGVEMIGVPQGGTVTVDAVLTPLGDAVMVDADVHATLDGECVRCLHSLHPKRTFHISEVFSRSDSLVVDTSATPNPDSDVTEDDDEPVQRIKSNRIDLLQSVTNEVGLSLPFNPTCENDYCDSDETDVPEPDGQAPESPGAPESTETIDPRWAGLEKFL